MGVGDQYRAGPCVHCGAADGGGRRRHRHRLKPAGVLRAEPAFSDEKRGRLPGGAFRHPAAPQNGRPHHPGGSAHRHPEHGHLLFQRAGAGQREQLRCRRHGGLCSLHEDRWFQHSARQQHQHGCHHLCGAELRCGASGPGKALGVGHPCYWGHLHPLHRRGAIGRTGRHSAPVHR